MLLNLDTKPHVLLAGTLLIYTSNLVLFYVINFIPGFVTEKCRYAKNFGYAYIIWYSICIILFQFLVSLQTVVRAYKFYQIIHVKKLYGVKLILINIYNILYETTSFVHSVIQLLYTHHIHVHIMYIYNVVRSV